MSVMWLNDSNQEYDLQEYESNLQNQSEWFVNESIESIQSLTDSVIWSQFTEGENYQRVKNRLT